MYSPADLPITDSGRIYHLNILPSQLAPSVILVGDPERVPLFADAHLAAIEADVSHRGLRTITGPVRTSGLPLTITTSGMGTPSLEIVLQELALLNEIDFAKRERKTSFEPLHLIRVGTSGALSAATELGTLILSEYAVGMDNTGLFYNAPFSDGPCAALEDRCRAVLRACAKSERFGESVFPYAAKANPAVLEALEESVAEGGGRFKRGVTISSSGFFANQGRDISRVLPAFPDLDRAFATAETGIAGLAFENMEMEASFLLHFAAAAGYPAGVICPVIANRSEDTFAADYLRDVERAGRAAVRALEKLHRSRGA